jgi:hypothetical protein
MWMLRGSRRKARAQKVWWLEFRRMEDGTTSLDRSYLHALAAWEGIGYVIAALLATWGVAITTNRFKTSDSLALAAGAALLIKITVETLKRRSVRHVILWALCAAGIVGAELITIRWAGRLASEVQEQQGKQQQVQQQIGQLPGMSKQLGELTATNTRLQQKLEDIGKDNEDLKKSIEQKDALLASIAQRQYALNFVPQLTAVTSGTTALRIANNGATKVTLLQLIVEGHVTPHSALPSELAKGAGTRFMLGAGDAEKIISREAFDSTLGKATSRLTGRVVFETGDQKQYALPFTWTFIVEDGKINASWVTTSPVEHFAGPQPASAIN